MMIQKLLSLRRIFTLLLLLLSFFVFKFDRAFASDISEGAEVQVVDKNTTISSKYTFSPQFNPSKSKVIPFGLQTTHLVSSATGYSYESFSPKSNSSLKGNFGVTYTNVGKYKNKDLDLKITVVDWDQYITNDTGKISFTTDWIAENVQGYNYVDQKWEFFEHGTNNKVKINAYMTINDIDGVQGVKFDRTTSSSINKILVDPSARNWLKYEKNNGEIYIYESARLGSTDDDIFAMATFLFDDIDQLRFKWVKDYTKTPTKKTKKFASNNPDGEYFGYLAIKLARTETLVPYKTIEDNGLESEEMTMAAHKTFTFNLYHQVPDELKNFYYSSYSITDTVDNHLDIQSIKVLNERDADVTSYFDNRTSGNSINLIAKSSILQSSSFYNHTYKVVVKVKAKDSEDYLNVAKDGKVTLKNVFAITKDGSEKQSNTVTVHLLPIAVINMNHIQIYTGKANKGLPIKLELTVDYPFGKDIPELNKKSITIGVYEKGSKTALFSQQYKLNSIPKKIDGWIIPPKNMVKDTHKNYEVRISGIDNLYSISRYPTIDTDGYTASEKAINVDAKDSDKVSYKGVIMTERKINKDMIIHYEKFDVPIQKLSRQKTGYGFDLQTDITYENDLTNDDFHVGAIALVDSKLIDSYLIYGKRDSYSVVPLEVTNTKQVNKSTTVIMNLPNVYVEKKTGFLFSKEQVASKDSRIHYEVVDGKRKIYVPIWTDLGKYNISVMSNNPIGVNETTFQINQTIDIYAYMFATINSETINEDEILIEPVNIQNPFSGKIPEGWTQQDIEWLKQ